MPIGCPQFDPFQLRFGDADADAGALITLNARGFFDFEHRAGVPSAAATHAETWKAWTDTKASIVSSACLALLPACATTSTPDGPCSPSARKRSPWT